MNLSSRKRSEQRKQSHQTVCCVCLGPMETKRGTKRFCSDKCRQAAKRNPEAIKLCPLPIKPRDKNQIESPLTERYYFTRWGTRSKMDITNIGKSRPKRRRSPVATIVLKDSRFLLIRIQ